MRFWRNLSKPRAQNVHNPCTTRAQFAPLLQVSRMKRFCLPLGSFALGTRLGASLAWALEPLSPSLDKGVCAPSPAH